jgi:hypothetical protein
MAATDAFGGRIPIVLASLVAQAVAASLPAQAGNPVFPGVEISSERSSNLFVSIFRVCVYWIARLRGQ